MTVIALLALLACKNDVADTSEIPTVVDTGDRVIPPVTADRSTVLGHAQECAQALGPIPGFDCIADADPVPVTVDGVPVTEDVETCDKPSLLEGSCNRWTRAGTKQGTWLNGDPRPEVEFVFTCRSYDDGPPTEEGGYYHDVAMIGHNRETGATCFFQSFPEERIRYFPSPMTADAAPDLGVVPAEQIWYEPAYTAEINCHRCHGADPWIHSPWIDQVRRHAVPGLPTVPDVLVPWTRPTADTPYHIVGTAFSGWRLTHFALEGNACLTCHRVAPGGGCGDFVRYAAGQPIWMPLTDSAQTWPGSTWMPPESSATEADWQAAWGPHVDELLACCGEPDAPACNRTDTPPGERYVEGIPDSGL